ncbi:MAG: TAXI family TRAP transporter solute-binding subunit [Granulosicoccus sp.]
MGKNHIQSVYDLLYLKGVDLALVRADAIEYIRRYGDFPNIQNVIRSFTKISEEKIIVLARDEFNSVEDLAGKTIGLGNAGSGEFVTGSIILESLGIHGQHTEINNSAALDQLKSGKLAAMVYLFRPTDAVQDGEDAIVRKRIRNLKLQDGIHALALPDNHELKSNYKAVNLTHDDLPGLIAEATALHTYSVDSILAAYNWQSDNARYKKVARFANAFIDSLDELKSGPYQPIWNHVELDSSTINVARIGLLDDIIIERERQKTDKEQAENNRVAAEKEALKAKNIAKLIKQREEITARLGEKMSTADSAELKKLMSQLSSFLQDLETSSSTPGDDAGN